MNTKLTLLIPNKLPALLKADSHLQRITATLLLLRSLYPEGRFDYDKMKEVSLQCGFKSLKGFKKGHIEALIAIGLAKYEYNEAHKITYVTLASWQEIKKHFEYERNNFTAYQVEVYSSRHVMALLISLDIQAEQLYFKSSFKANLKANPELLDAIKTVCGETSRQAIHNYQLKVYTEGLPVGRTDEYYFAAYMLLHSTKKPTSAKDNEEKAKRFYLKADCNVSVGYLSRARGYTNRNGMCYWKKQLQVLGLATCERREYEVKKNERTTTAQRATGIGTNFFDPIENRLKLRLTDQWQFISPEVAFVNQPAKTDANGAMATVAENAANAGKISTNG